MTKLRYLRPAEGSMFLQRLSGDHNNYNWWDRVVFTKPPRVKTPLNQRMLGGIFSKLHHYGSHAPAAVRAKWKEAEQAFMARHLPDCTSVRFANKFTAHRWL